MRILIEEYQYPAEKVEDIISGLTNLRNIHGKVSVNHVGYYYNPTLADTVFILPKVLLEECADELQNGGRADLLFGHCKPEDVIHLEEQKVLSKEEYEFIYELAVWIYRAITVFRDTHPDSDVVQQQLSQQMAKGRLKKCNTYLDILLALQKFNQENQNFFFYVLRNMHSGFNKINWNKTISHATAFVQDGTPIYLNPINKKRQINFDEELLVIFFSILNYIKITYGFPVTINVNIDLITGKQFERYVKNGLGITRLHKIKYKYFSDKALYLWELCYAFFERKKKIDVETNEKEYLLVKNFNVVFEAIIDELLTGDQQLPAGLIEQEDGKRVDHMYKYDELTNNKNNNPIYYIGDSKYYKRNTSLGKEAVYKQFTYARNVIQWNMDLFNDKKLNGEPKLMDEITEGYNVIPNFFISAEQNTLESKSDIHLTNKKESYYTSRQFDNRLFDRDTFLVAHYDVNFLFVVALYGKNNEQEKSGWRKKVRELFRKEIQSMVEKKFEFHVLTPREGVSAVSYIEDHFQQLLGKIFTPYEDRGVQKYYSLALDKGEAFEEENAALLGQIRGYFYEAKCDSMGDDPKDLLPEVEPMAISMRESENFLTYHYLERYQDKEILIGCYHSQEQLNWILTGNDKGTLIYNVRIGKGREGAQKRTHLENKKVPFVIIYEFGKESENKYRAFRVHHHAIMNQERMAKAGYPNPNGSYFCYVFDEEVTLGDININAIISRERIEQGEAFVEGAPIFKTGDEVMKYRK